MPPAAKWEVIFSATYLASKDKVLHDIDLQLIRYSTKPKPWMRREIPKLLKRRETLEQLLDKLERFRLKGSDPNTLERVFDEEDIEINGHFCLKHKSWKVFIKRDDAARPRTAIIEQLLSDGQTPDDLRNLLN